MQKPFKKMSSKSNQEYKEASDRIDLDFKLIDLQKSDVINISYKNGGSLSKRVSFKSSDSSSNINIQSDDESESGPASSKP